VQGFVQVSKTCKCVAGHTFILPVKAAHEDCVRTFRLVVSSVQGLVQVLGVRFRSEKVMGRRTALNPSCFCLKTIVLKSATCTRRLFSLGNLTFPEANHTVKNAPYSTLASAATIISAVPTGINLLSLLEKRIRDCIVAPLAAQALPLPDVVIRRESAGMLIRKVAVHSPHSAEKVPQHLAGILSFTCDVLPA